MIISASRPGHVSKGLWSSTPSLQDRLERQSLRMDSGAGIWAAFLCLESLLAAICKGLHLQGRISTASILLSTYTLWKINLEEAFNTWHNANSKHAGMSAARGWRWWFITNQSSNSLHSISTNNPGWSVARALDHYERHKFLRTINTLLVCRWDNTCAAGDGFGTLNCCHSYTWATQHLQCHQLHSSSCSTRCRLPVRYILSNSKTQMLTFILFF